MAVALQLAPGMVLNLGTKTVSYVPPPLPRVGVGLNFVPHAKPANAAVSPSTIVLLSSLPNAFASAANDVLSAAVLCVAQIYGGSPATGSAVSASLIGCASELTVPILSSSSDVLAAVAELGTEVNSAALSVASVVSPSSIQGTSFIESEPSTGSLVVSVPVLALAIFPSATAGEGSSVTPVYIYSTVSIPVPLVLTGADILTQNLIATVLIHQPHISIVDALIPGTSVIADTSALTNVALINLGQAAYSDIGTNLGSPAHGD